MIADIVTLMKAFDRGVDREAMARHHVENQQTKLTHRVAEMGKALFAQQAEACQTLHTLTDEVTEALSLTAEREQRDRFSRQLLHLEEIQSELQQKQKEAKGKLQEMQERGANLTHALQTLTDTMKQDIPLAKEVFIALGQATCDRIAKAPICLPRSYREKSSW